MSNEELSKEIFKLQCDIADLRCIVFQQCATIFNLINENQEIKKIIVRDSMMKKENEKEGDYACNLIKTLEKIYERESKRSYK